MQLDVQVNIQYTLYIVRYVNNNNNNINNSNNNNNMEREFNSSAKYWKIVIAWYDFNDMNCL